MNIQTVVNKYATKYPNLNKFFNEFIENFPTEDDYKDRIWDYVDLDDLDEDEEITYEDVWDPEADVNLLESEFDVSFDNDGDFVEIWVDFYNDLCNTNWGKYN